MATNYPSIVLKYVFASSGNYVLPPATAAEAGSGRLSQAEGWGSINETPLEDGGIAPFREDFNGLAYALSAPLLWLQQGGIYKYDASLDYEPTNEIFYQGKKYRCLKANGASSTAVVPGADATTWRNMDNQVPAGAVLPFYNVTLGGSDGRRPIFWGQTEADEGWVLCDGGTDGNSGNVPNLVDKFIRGSSVANAGTTGGADSQTLATVPAHTHTITIGTAGNHTHTRGTMNITGKFGMRGLGEQTQEVSGAFTNEGFTAATPDTGYDYSQTGMGFDASKSWTGETSSSGAHTHTATCASTGGDTTVSTLPSYFSLAYFVRLPEA